LNEQVRKVAEQVRKAERLDERLSVLEAAASARMRDLAKQDQTKQQAQARAVRVQAEQREDELAKLDRAMGIEPAGGVRMEGFTQVFAMDHRPPHVYRKTRSVFWPFDADSEQHEGKKEVLKNQLASDEPVGGTSGTAPRALAFSFDGTTRRTP
jgi:glucose/arabinose dehydrogenase